MSTIFFMVIGSFTIAANSLIDGTVKTKREETIFVVYHGVLELNCSTKFPLVKMTMYCGHLVVKVCASGRLLARRTFVPFIIALLGCAFTLPNCMCLGTIKKANGAQVAFLFRIAAAIICLKCLC